MFIVPLKGYFFIIDSLLISKSRLIYCIGLDTCNYPDLSVIKCTEIFPILSLNDLFNNPDSTNC